jgi:hypothetical protein
VLQEQPERTLKTVGTRRAINRWLELAAMRSVNQRTGDNPLMWVASGLPTIRQVVT